MFVFDTFQSLSRDSWWSNHHRQGRSRAVNFSFNPSVGILGGQTQRVMLYHYWIPQFQSLSRDSWWSNGVDDVLQQAEAVVSIPQSGFLVVKPAIIIVHNHPSGVSIPQSGFLVVKPHEQHGNKEYNERFNPSVGILGGQTNHLWSITPPYQAVSIPQSGFLVVKLRIPQRRGGPGFMFQSLSRDSWWSNPAPLAWSVYPS